MTTPRPKSATAPGRTEKQVQTVTCVGIDPGLSGGIAWIRPDRSADARIAPILEYTNGKRDFDRSEMVGLLARLPKPVFAAIEKVNAAPMRGRRQGTGSMFSFGRGFGLWLGMLAACDIPFVEVDPRKWKAAILSGTAKDKAAAIGYARTFFPAVSLLPSPRHRKPADGLADALCLAEYARREWKTRQLLKGAHA